jgi:CheY-like chemotaxis protein
MPEPGAEPSIEGVRILVVDDNADALEMLELSLGISGARVKAVTSVDDAVQADPAAFDVVITDLSMPGRSGFELLRAFRERAPAVPVIAVTGHSLLAEQERDRSGGFSMYLIKPVEHPRLVRAIHDVVTGPRRGEAT